MTFLLDENFPVSAAAFLRQRGHEAFLSAETCGRGATDEEIFAEAQRRHAILLTSDRDFYHTIPLLHPDHCGIVVVALRQPTRTAILLRLEWFLNNAPQPVENRAYVLRDQTYRLTPA